MWSPYPDHYLTLWALPASTAISGSHLDRNSHVQKTKHQNLRFWQLSRNFTMQPNHPGKTSEYLASHRLNLGNQSICRLTIPISSINYLTNLVELRIPQNKLTSLPYSLFLMTQIEILNLENNLLDEEGTEDWWWRGMENLRVLFLASNRFKQVPPSLGKLPRLFYLDVSDNPRLECLPIELLLSESIGTLAAHRCSAEIADLLDSRNQKIMSWHQFSKLQGHTSVPGLSRMCVQKIHRAIGQEMEGAYHELVRNPEEYPVAQLLLPWLESAHKQHLCTVCGSPVFFDSFNMLQRIEDHHLPFLWTCCSPECQHNITTVPLPRSSGA